MKFTGQYTTGFVQYDSYRNLSHYTHFKRRVGTCRQCCHKHRGEPQTIHRRGTDEVQRDCRNMSTRLGDFITRDDDGQCFYSDGNLIDNHLRLQLDMLSKRPEDTQHLRLSDVVFIGSVSRQASASCTSKKLADVFEIHPDTEDRESGGVTFGSFVRAWLSIPVSISKSVKQIRSKLEMICVHVKIVPLAGTLLDDCNNDKRVLWEGLVAFQRDGVESDWSGQFGESASLNMASFTKMPGCTEEKYVRSPLRKILVAHMKKYPAVKIQLTGLPSWTQVWSNSIEPRDAIMSDARPAVNVAIDETPDVAADAAADAEDGRRKNLHQDDDDMDNDYTDDELRLAMSLFLQQPVCPDVLLDLKYTEDTVDDMSPMFRHDLKVAIQEIANMRK